MRTVIAIENKNNWKQLQLLLDKGIKRWFNDRYSLNQVESSGCQGKSIAFNKRCTARIGLMMIP